MPEETEAKTSKDADSTGLGRAAERLREAARWLIGAFAAVGVVLAGGLQLADVGELTLDDPLRLSLALLGLLATVVGIALAINSAAKIPTSSYVSLHWLADHPNDPVAQRVTSDSTLTAGLTLQQLHDNIRTGRMRAEELYAATHAAGPPGESAPERETRLRAAREAYEPVRLEAERLTTIRNNVLDLASFSKVTRAYEDARTGIFVGSLLVATGLISFAWGANGPDRPPIPGGEVLPKMPSEVTVLFSERVPAPILKLVGPKCDARALDAIAVSVKGDTYQVVAVQTAVCTPALFDVAPADGRVVPRVAAPTEEGDTAGTADE